MVGKLLHSAANQNTITTMARGLSKRCIFHSNFAVFFSAVEFSGRSARNYVNVVSSFQ